MKRNVAFEARMAFIFNKAMKEFFASNFVNSYHLAVNGLTDLNQFKDNKTKRLWKDKFKQLMNKSVKKNLSKLGF